MNAVAVALLKTRYVFPAPCARGMCARSVIVKTENVKAGFQPLAKR